MTVRLIPTFLLGAAALGLAACGGADADTAATTGDRTSFELPTDHAIGSVDAPITVVEYSSVACAACGRWHTEVYKDFKAKFIDTGRVRYVVREFPAGDPTIFKTGSMLANCADDREPGAFFSSIDLQFERQQEILRYRTQAPQRLREQYAFIAEQGGLDEQEMIECLSDTEIEDEIEQRVQAGIDQGVGVTPTFIVNGEARGKLWEVEDFEKAFAELDTPDAG